MSDKADGEALNTLHRAIATELTSRIQTGEAKSADLSAAIAFLKNNNITADAEVNKPLAGLAQSFPEFNDDEDADTIADSILQ